MHHSRSPYRWLLAMILALCLTSPALAATKEAPLSKAKKPAAGKDTAQVDVLETRKGGSALPADLTFRARVTAIEPSKAVDINWRYGGEGLGGSVCQGNLVRRLPVGEWTPNTGLATLVKGPWPPAFQGRYWFITFTLGDAASHGVETEFEFNQSGKVIKTVKAPAPDGGTVGIVVPHYLLRKGKDAITADFINELTGLKEYAERRAARTAALPWAKGPVPSKFMIGTDIAGYGKVGYGVRHSDKAIVEAEVATVRQMGVNSLRSAPDFLREMARRHEGIGKAMGMAEISSAAGFPVPAYRKDRKDNDPECGCPFGSRVAGLTTNSVHAALAKNLAIPVPEVWALTIDEIGTVFDHAPEGRKHMDTCPRCAAAFREYVKALGATPADFAKTDWAEVKPGWGGGPKATSYYTRKFNNYATAKLFVELRKAFDAENTKKRQALAAGNTSSAVARQPWIYSYALRGNTFLMAGHSLDFFDFYRYADNAFMYETSNRGWQIWQWDSYLCDVGRILDERMHKRFGIIIKPHRGAPVQRALAAVSRGAKLLYWYTYGPDYYKGDTFCSEPEAIALAVKAAHLIGKSEDVLWGATWAKPAEVAIVKPRCSEFLGNDEQWESAKWVYTALAHAHIPVDPIDEVMLAQDDLSKYKIIYMNGSHLPRKSAEALAKYVADGGTLWTSGWGCARDEADEPLTALQAVLGLEDRAAPEIWRSVGRYKAGAVQSFVDPRSQRAAVPAGAKITGTGPYAASFIPVVGREVLRPGRDTDVLAQFADGGAAMTRHRHGKGVAYVAGFYPGLEYSATVRDGAADMSRDFDAARRSFIAIPALALTQPVVSTSVPAVEGVLLKNAANGKHAVTLMNWAYTVAGADARGRQSIVIAELKDVRVLIRGVGDVKKATSAMLDRELPLSRSGDTIEVTVPQLAEGDVLILE